MATYSSLSREGRKNLSLVETALILKGASQPVRPYFYNSNTAPVLAVGDDTDMNAQSVVLREDVRLGLSRQLNLTFNENYHLTSTSELNISHHSMNTIHVISNNNMNNSNDNNNMNNSNDNNNSSNNDINNDLIDNIINHNNSFISKSNSSNVDDDGNNSSCNGNSNKNNNKNNNNNNNNNRNNNNNSNNNNINSNNNNNNNNNNSITKSNINKSNSYKTLLRRRSRDDITIRSYDSKKVSASGSFSSITPRMKGLEVIGRSFDRSDNKSNNMNIDINRNDSNESHVSGRKNHNNDPSYQNDTIDTDKDNKIVSSADIENEGNSNDIPQIKKNLKNSEISPNLVSITKQKKPKAPNDIDIKNSSNMSSLLYKMPFTTNQNLKINTQTQPPRRTVRQPNKNSNINTNVNTNANININTHTILNLNSPKSFRNVTTGSLRHPFRPDIASPRSFRSGNRVNLKEDISSRINENPALVNFTVIVGKLYSTRLNVL